MKTKITLIALLMLSFLWASNLRAEVDVNININLPLVQVNEEPVMAVIPGTYIYFFTHNSMDFFFFDGFWWRFYGNRWYRANHYNGPWMFRKNKYVPAPFFRLSPEWRKQAFIHSGIKYQEMKKNWKQWQKQKHWEQKMEKKEKKQDKGSKQEKQIKDNQKGGKGRK